MVEVRRLSEQDIYDNFQKLRELISRATKRGGGNTNDYTRLLINSIANPHVFAGGIFKDNELHGLFIVIAGMSYFTPDTAAYMVLLSLDNEITAKDAYTETINVLSQWMKDLGVNTLIGSSPRRGFLKLVPTIDPKWQVRQLLVLELQHEE